MHLKRELKGALLILISVILVPLAVWIFNGLRLGLWTYAQYDRYFWLTENLGIARELWHGNIKAGDDSGQLTNVWNPDDLSRFGHWTRMDWYPGGLRKGTISLIGITVIARDGVLVEANSWTDDGLDARVFFNSLNSESESDFRKAFEEYVKASIEKQKRDNRLTGDNP